MPYVPQTLSPWRDDGIGLVPLIPQSPVGHLPDNRISEVAAGKVDANQVWSSAFGTVDNTPVGIYTDNKLAIEIDTSQNVTLPEGNLTLTSGNLTVSNATTPTVSQFYGSIAGGDAEWLEINRAAGFQIQAKKSGNGNDRNLSIYAGDGALLQFGTGSSIHWLISSLGILRPNLDASLDFCSSGVRPTAAYLHRLFCDNVITLQSGSSFAGDATFADRLLLADGTEAAPSWAYSGNQNHGFYRASATIRPVISQKAWLQFDGAGLQFDSGAELGFSGGTVGGATRVRFVKGSGNGHMALMHDYAGSPAKLSIYGSSDGISPTDAEWLELNRDAGFQIQTKKSGLGQERDLTIESGGSTYLRSLNANGYYQSNSGSQTRWWIDERTGADCDLNLRNSDQHWRLRALAANLLIDPETVDAQIQVRSRSNTAMLQYYTADGNLLLNQGYLQHGSSSNAVPVPLRIYNSSAQTHQIRTGFSSSFYVEQGRSGSTGVYAFRNESNAQLLQMRASGGTAGESFFPAGYLSIGRDLNAADWGEVLIQHTGAYGRIATAAGGLGVAGSLIVQQGRNKYVGINGVDDVWTTPEVPLHVRHDGDGVGNNVSALLERTNGSSYVELRGRATSISGVSFSDDITTGSNGRGRIQYRNQQNGSGEQMEIFALNGHRLTIDAGSLRPNTATIELGTSAQGWAALYVDGADITAPNLPTSDPAIAGRFWNDAGNVRVSGTVRLDLEDTDAGVYDLGTGTGTLPAVQLTGLTVQVPADAPSQDDLLVSLRVHIVNATSHTGAIELGIGVNLAEPTVWIASYVPASFSGLISELFRLNDFAISASANLNAWARLTSGSHPQYNVSADGSTTPHNLQIASQ